MVNQFQHYKDQTITTMTQSELLLLLFDELAKRLMRCDLALQQGEYALLDESADRCIAILRYLDNTLDRRYEISHELHRLYDYFIYEMQRVKFGRNKEQLDQVRPMMLDLRDTFRMAEKKYAEEK